MRGIADHFATRLAHHAFNVNDLGMLCWALGKLKVMQLLSGSWFCDGPTACACCHYTQTMYHGFVEVVHALYLHMAARTSGKQARR